MALPSDSFWTHFYGLPGFLALLIQLWPVISPRFARFSFGSKNRRRKKLTEEIASLQFQSRNDIFVQRFFRALISRCVAWAIPGIAISFWGLAYQDKLSSTGLDVVYSLVAICFGSAIGIAVSLTIRMNQFADVDDEISALQAKLDKLNN